MPVPQSPRKGNAKNQAKYSGGLRGSSALTHGNPASVCKQAFLFLILSRCSMAQSKRMEGSSCRPRPRHRSPPLALVAHRARAALVAPRALLALAAPRARGSSRSLGSRPLTTPLAILNARCSSRSPRARCSSRSLLALAAPRARHFLALAIPCAALKSKKASTFKRRALFKKQALFPKRDSVARRRRGRRRRRLGVRGPQHRAKPGIWWPKSVSLASICS